MSYDYWKESANPGFSIHLFDHFYYEFDKKKSFTVITDGDYYGCDANCLTVSKAELLSD